MLTFLGRRPASRPRLFTERGQGLALLICGLAVLFAVCLIAKGRLL